MKKVRKVIYVVIMCVLLCVFGYSLYNVYKIYSEYEEGNSTYEDLLSDVAMSDEPNSTESASNSPIESTADVNNKQEISIGIDFNKLRKINKDVIGWIYNPGTVINYPVVQGKDNEYYLKHLIDGTYNASGTPFLDCNMKPDFSDKNNFIYAHHMKNGSMFSSITKYKDLAYYNKHNHMYLITPAKKYRLEVFSAYITEATSDTYVRGFGENEEFKKYIDYLRSKSLIKTNVEVTIKDTIVSLSTCTYEYENARFVVHTKRVPIN